ncbi:MAG TPA: DUF3108 domain-containing protein [Gemmatimonadaceae bacterium]|jgi:hypothetical protein|nr:DUF3108 domain-containing protein [Gemmatimonadaceae bacterium]
MSRTHRFVIALALLGVAIPAAVRAQSASALPFAIGERLTYDGRVRGIGGKGTMWIAGPVDVRGVSTYELHFDFSARVGPMTVSQRSTSWLDPERMAAMRFTKKERRLLARHDEKVELFPDERRWTADNGASGASPTSAPLDELSFIYFVRTLPLTADSTLRFARHFDAERSPTIVHVLGHEQVTTAAGVFGTVVVEMRVRDPEHYRGEGRIRFSISDDRCRIPVRIESTIPDAGTVVLTLADAGGDTLCPARLARR